jgi:septal ring factor EnvC (AmiA/AmiB activator)
MMIFQTIKIKPIRFKKCCAILCKNNVLTCFVGLDNSTLPSSTQEIQRQMEKLNKEIEMQKSEINSISQNIATASTEIGTSALANIALPSNLQQILDSIKTIGSTSGIESLETKVSSVQLSKTILT